MVKTTFNQSLSAVKDYIYPNRIFRSKPMPGSVPTPVPESEQLQASIPEPSTKTAVDILCISRTDLGHILTYSDDKFIGELIRTTGRCLEGDIDLARGIIEGLGVSVGLSTFVDVGANIGTHALHSLRSGFKRAVCVEADLDNFKLLRVNQILNDVDQYCVNVLAAASSNFGEATFELSPVNFGDHRVRVGNSYNGLHNEIDWQLRTVPTMRLDTILSEVPESYRDIGLVWIDTQGHEGHVLHGASELLRSGVPIIAEFWPYGLSRSGGYQMLREAITASGRRIFDLRQCIASGNPRLIDPETELDKIFRSLLENETTGQSAHTDLILI